MLDSVTSVSNQSTTVKPEPTFRIEDTLVVSDAAPRVLTEAPRGLRVVG